MVQRQNTRRIDAEWLVGGVSYLTNDDYDYIVDDDESRGWQESAAIATEAAEARDPQRASIERQQRRRECPFGGERAAERYRDELSGSQQSVGEEYSSERGDSLSECADAPQQRSKQRRGL